MIKNFEEWVNYMGYAQKTEGGGYFWESRAHNNSQVCRYRLCFEGRWNARAPDQVHKTHCNVPDALPGSWINKNISWALHMFTTGLQAFDWSRDGAVMWPSSPPLKLLITMASILKQGHFGTCMPASSLYDGLVDHSWPMSHILCSLSTGFLSKRHVLLKWRHRWSHTKALGQVTRYIQIKKLYSLVTRHLTVIFPRVQSS